MFLKLVVGTSGPKPASTKISKPRSQIGKQPSIWHNKSYHKKSTAYHWFTINNKDILRIQGKRLHFQYRMCFFFFPRGSPAPSQDWLWAWGEGEPSPRAINRLISFYRLLKNTNQLLFVLAKLSFYLFMLLPKNAKVLWKRKKGALGRTFKFLPVFWWT